jgi:hypothetical protein
VALIHDGCWDEIDEPPGMVIYVDKCYKDLDASIPRYAIPQDIDNERRWSARQLSKEVDKVGFDHLFVD